MMRAAAIAVTTLAALPFGIDGARAAELKMSYNSDWPPYSAGVGENVAGILPDLMNAIVGERMGMKVRHFGYPWKRAQRAVETGQLDAMVTVPTKSRLNYAESSESTVYTIEMRPIVALGGAAEYKISSSSDPVTLKSLKLCDIIGNGWGKRFAETHGLTPVLATKVSSCLRMVAKGRTEVTIQAGAVAHRQISAENLGQQLSVLPKPYGTMKFTLLLSKKSALGVKFMKAFDAKLAEMNADGSYGKLVQRLKMGAPDPK